MLIPDHHLTVPKTETEWLMQPYQEMPDLSEKHIDDVVAAIDQLTPRERLIVNAIYFERATYMQLGQRLGFSHVHAWRLTKQAVNRLRHLIENEGSPMIETWEQAAWSVIKQYDRTLPRPASVDTISYCTRRMSETVRNLQEPQPMLFCTLAMEAVGELMLENLWSATSFHEMLVDKQRDYGCENINAFGLMGIAVRLNDKVARLKNLLKSGLPPRNESLHDTWIDLVGYCTIAEMFHNGTFQLPLEDSPTTPGGTAAGGRPKRVA